VGRRCRACLTPQTPAPSSAGKTLETVVPPVLAPWLVAQALPAQAILDLDLDWIG